MNKPQFKDYGVPVFHDDRGTFSATPIRDGESQVNISFNDKAGTFRGMHLQLGEFAQTKRLRVIRGEIIDFIASMIPGDDPNEVLQFRMTPGQELTVPKGWAHGFATLQPDTIVQYVIDEPYEPTIEQSIHWKSWRPIRKVLNELTSLQISPKDQIAPELIEVYQKISETYKHLTQ